jgi:rhodanese-related sulfurtransferase
LYPAHDYQGRTVTSVKEEKAYNTRLALHGTEEEFVSFMQNLHLPPPAAMQEALTRNYELGKPETGMYPELASWAPLEKTHDGILQVPYAWMQAHAPFITVVDVSEKGDDSLQFLHTRIQHIPLRFLEQRYQETVKEKPIVLCCHSGISSARAFGILQAKGISRVAILKR